jgi:hypothetical protein
MAPTEALTSVKLSQFEQVVVDRAFLFSALKQPSNSTCLKPLTATMKVRTPIEHHTLLYGALP